MVLRRDNEELQSRVLPSPMRSIMKLALELPASDTIVNKPLDCVKGKAKEMAENLPTDMARLSFATGTYNPNSTFTSRKLAYGKVDDTSLPQDYDPSPTQTRYIETNPALAAELPEDLIVVTTIPSRYFDKPDDPDGHSEWIVNGCTKAKIVNAKGYPCEVPKPSRPDMFEVRSTPTMGMGVFATCDILMGELVFAERPLLVFPTLIPINGRHYQRNWSREDVLKVAMFEWEKSLQYAVGRMNETDQKEFLGLANNHKEDGSGQLLGIMRTNGYGIRYLGDGPDRPPGDEYPDSAMYSAICRIGSRINHSCMPNITHTFKRSSFSFQFSAARGIKAGEQLFYAYCNVNQTASERKADLAPYGVICQCICCVNASPKTDKLRRELIHRISQYRVDAERWAKMPNLSVSVLKPVLELKEEMIKEGLHSQVQAYSILLEACLRIYVQLGMKEEANGYIKELRQYKSLPKDGM